MVELIKAERNEIRPIIDDPQLLFSSFRLSPQYHTAITARATALRFPGTGDWNEFTTVFEKTDTCATLFQDYFKTINFRYNPLLPCYDSINEDIAAYRILVQTTSQNERSARDPSDIIAADRERSLLHSDTAKKLIAAGVAPSHKLARIFLSKICNTNPSGRQLTYFEQIRQSLVPEPRT